MWQSVYMLGFFIAVGVVPLNFLVKGLKKLGVPYWPRIIIGVIYLLVITRLVDMYLI
ncbi:hypothetical protein MFMK1_000064 [Metallumcola ferriviriculae]|uniref:Uncharacterized protein n=1 Tax=Metallumcola ferriviriculae TaxID=3039180 RepID=A0AAU0UII4_9FIRM|nr:hypothetical protein MFMK1_000064 [Desulfitibacteraceae bacterium MK1]